MNTKLTVQELVIGYLAIPCNSRPSLDHYCREALALEKQIAETLKQIKYEEIALLRQKRDEDANGSF
uniref:Uncharacterized protein n=1 Tax=Bracon brevicornis TaxID=1563983 RepID=A0A6V7KEM7_9HYME